MTVLYYARVSSGRQENEQTIQSQVAELRARMMEDGVADPQGFTDEGYSRDNLVRPGLDRERDLAAQQELERLAENLKQSQTASAGVPGLETGGSINQL